MKQLLTKIFDYRKVPLKNNRGYLTRFFKIRHGKNFINFLTFFKDSLTKTRVFLTYFFKDLLSNKRGFSIEFNDFCVQCSF